ncbi:hypothetical protein [Xenorhabdus lircayensis]|uniref:Uncharacterized protein n=1 Tax=Xenorhabdus lircayensis TaxID=2763499 RepID=A0ABS0U6D0_9GAMM|nr:hypothetical protein [Xenorhabdus lircayensis]MBI6549039.1 hypothetical protein [Xenorhabdus lircayensis]
MINIARRVLEETRIHGITHKELDEARNMWRIEKQEIESSASYWADALAQIATDDGDFSRLTQAASLVEVLNVDDINQIAHQWLGKNEKVFLLTPPENKVAP